MSVREALQLSEDEWQECAPGLREKLMTQGAKIGAERLLATNAMLQDDDRDIRKRQKAVEKSLLGQDANNCTDEPYEEEAGEDVRITILGDVNGDESLRMLNQQNRTVPPPPAERPNRLLPALGLLAAVALGSGLTFAASQFFGDQEEGKAYDIVAVPYIPSE